MRKAIMFATLSFLLLFLAIGCTNDTENESAAVDAADDESDAAETDILRFAVGPYQPTPEETRKAYEPFIEHIAAELDIEYELTVTNDWAGISVALASDQVDMAWMGPWGYVLAHVESGAEAIATVEYESEPTYQAIILAGQGHHIEHFPEDSEGMSISFADMGSTSGWLIPTYYFQTEDIDPQTFFQYSEGASHASNAISVAEGHVDLATDYDRNRRAMIEAGRLKEEATEIVWQSDPLPNDPVVVREDFDAQLKKQLQDILVNISEEEAEEILPEHYTGFVEASHGMYQIIEDAGVAVGQIEVK